MRHWVTRQLAAEGTQPVVVLDPDGVLIPDRTIGGDEIALTLGAAEVHTAWDWFELRRVWEQHGRRRDGAVPRLVIVTHDQTITSANNLPFDIEQASVVCRLRVPAPHQVQPAFRSLDDQASDRALELMDGTTASPVEAVLGAAVGIFPPGILGSPARELQLALRLVDPKQPTEVLELARRSITDSLAQSVLASPPRLDDVQRAWDEWIARPSDSAYSYQLAECRSELIDLFATGKLLPARAGGEATPGWAAIGIASESPAARVAALLAAAPAPAGSLEDWVRVAQWWGEVRSGLAQVNPPDQQLQETAWRWWGEVDELFLAWLRSDYGGQLTRSWATWPPSVDKIQPFLASRRPAGSRVLLVVLDGMGFTQWTRIRELTQLGVVQAGGVLAMLPTLTEVSRQAIAAGVPPIEFSDSLRSTSRERQRWADAWSSTTSTSTAWLRIDAARVEELEAIPFGSVDVIGLVLSATDGLMHGAELLGDIGLHAGIEAWVRSGVLSDLFAAAAEHGYETWLTADHGNLAVEPTPEPREGAFVERAGTRARRYASKALRDDAAVEGVIWDALPGYPSEEAERLLFAPFRRGWGTSRLAHGGLSLDEVIVPLVRIELPT